MTQAMTNDKTDRLAEIETRLERATPGPWVKCLGSGNVVCTAVLTHAVKNKHGNHPIIADCLPDYCLKHDTGVDDDHRPNLAFIAHSWEDIAYLLAEVKRLRADLAAVREVSRVNRLMAEQSMARLIRSSEGGEAE